MHSSARQITCHWCTAREFAFNTHSADIHFCCAHRWCPYINVINRNLFNHVGLSATNVHSWPRTFRRTKIHSHQTLADFTTCVRPSNYFMHIAHARAHSRISINRYQMFAHFFLMWIAQWIVIKWFDYIVSITRASLFCVCFSPNSASPIYRSANKRKVNKFLW